MRCQFRRGNPGDERGQCEVKPLSFLEEVFFIAREDNFHED